MVQSIPWNVTRTMGQVLHGSATTTEAIRRAIQNSEESLRVLAKRHGINQKIVAKWRKRTSVADLPTGLKDAKSTVLKVEEEAVIKAVPYKIHTVLTYNGIQFTFPPRYANGPTATWMSHMFDMRCEENGIEHRLTKIKHPRTNGQVERMNRTIKEATVKRFHYDDHAQLRRHLVDFMDAYNFGRRLKTLKGLTPYEFICKCWTSEPERFILNPLHQMPGLYN